MEAIVQQDPSMHADLMHASHLRQERSPGAAVLVDAGDVIVHIFRPELRRFYNLEKMWGGDRPVEMRPV